MQSSVSGKRIGGCNKLFYSANFAFGMLPALCKQAIKRKCVSISGYTAKLIV